MSRFPLTNVHPDAIIGENVTIEPFATVQKNVVIGDGCWIGPNVTIMEGARIGKNCKIFPGAVISGVPQDLKFRGEETTAEIGDNTTVRECVTINRGTVDKYKTVIGSDCLIMAYAHIGHDCIIGNNCILGNTVQLAGHVVIDDFAIFGGACAVQQFSKIGAHAYIGGGSLVRKDIPPFTKAAREPLSYAGINTVGLRRRGYSSEKINEIQEIYRMIFMKGLNNSKAIEMVENEVPSSEERDYILDFIRNSERGIMKGYEGND
ncbi:MULTISPECIES: acyl-ACP--UDP-N-acetylglucosamine O-acyltransferase [Chryseolinea]|jgi:UDP-N-acetylglucosamine acyltransferase|uniref:Acyl-[acyl-carrier-protein]--UDP-N-acetylglucosamine O-acyltransferase n=2 Tax=Chryseolinea TaxID=1433993 RepID=A0A1M5U7N6_9BACT|nr:MULTISPECIES: acyl-ACP--UDP-N-acetylglucosamine O-acyltransferase [Chryseolinea]AYB32272.1 acyl-ACP--UDP-N-acetylglucosamine O-acyltransferase [Chryseolinea soli]SHH58969.1 acyl-[acyl-carrier-protein]--UDP-N-acetylglucosamine O-acyltransferase [Chryseolinea serpens]